MNPRDPQVLKAHKLSIFSKMMVDAKPGVVIPYLEGVRDHPSQWDFHFSDWKTCWIEKAQRAGGSIALAAEHVARLGFPNYRQWQVAPEYDLCERIFEYIWRWVVVDEVYGPGSVNMKLSSMRTDKMQVTMNWGNGHESWVRAKSANSEKSLRGEQLDFCSVDEAPMLSSKVYEQDLLPRMANRDGDMVLSGSPQGINWFTKRWDEAFSGERDIDAWKAIRMTQLDNPFISREVIQRYKRVMSDREFKEQILGQPQHYAGCVFDEYLDRVWEKDMPGHLYDPEVVDLSGASWWRGIDIGVRLPTACVWIAVNREGDLYLAKEYNQIEPSHAEHAKNIRAMSWQNVVMSGISADAARKDGMTGTDQTNAHRVYRENGVYCRTIPTGQNWWDSARECMAQYLRATLEDNPEHPRLFINKNCEQTRRAIQGYIWQPQERNKYDKDGPPRPLKRDDHLIDAIFHCLMLRPTYKKPARLMQREMAQRPPLRRRGIRGLAQVPI